MNPLFDRRLTEFHRRPPVDPAVTRAIEVELGTSLPEEYKQLLQFTNGGEGSIGDGAYLILWAAEELMDLNRAYEVADYANGQLVFGSNGGGEAFGFDMRAPSWPIVPIPWIVLSWEAALLTGNSILDFLERLETWPAD